MTRFLKILMLIGAIVAAVIAALMMHGCATTKAGTTIVKSCAPPTADFMALVIETVDGATTVENAVTEAEVLAAQTAICTVTQIAKDVLASAAGIQLAAPGAPAPMRVQWANAWVKAHS